MMDLHLFNTESDEFIKNLGAVSTSAKKRRLNISKSYTKGAMALCISNFAGIGVDLEAKTDRPQETIEHFADKFSTFQIANMPVDINTDWFYKAWTAMESYFKLTGAGFGTKKDFVLNLDEKSIVKDDKQVAWLEHFDIGNFIVCICSGAPFSRQQVNCHSWGD